MGNKVSLNVKCTKCNHTLMDYRNELNGKPSIRVNIKNEAGDTGELLLCSTYGCYEKSSTIPLVDGTDVEASCPHCKEILNTNIPCKERNDGHMIKFNIEIGGVVSICSKVGCDCHYVMFDDLDDTLRKFHREYGF